MFLGRRSVLLMVRVFKNSGFNIFSSIHAGGKILRVGIWHSSESESCFHRTKGESKPLEINRSQWQVVWTERLRKSDVIYSFPSFPFNLLAWTPTWCDEKLLRQNFLEGQASNRRLGRVHSRLHIWVPHLANQLGPTVKF